MERVKDQYKHTLRQSPRLGPIRLKRRWLGDQGDSASLGSPVTRFKIIRWPDVRRRRKFGNIRT